MNVLEKIIKDKKEEIDKRKRNFPIKNFDLKNNFPERFLQSLNKKPIGFIAEIKRKISFGWSDKKVIRYSKNCF